MTDTPFDNSPLIFLGELSRRGIEASFSPRENLIHASFNGRERVFDPGNLLSLAPAVLTQQTADLGPLSFQVIVSNTGYIFVSDADNPGVPLDEFPPQQKDECFKALDKSGAFVLGVNIDRGVVISSRPIISLSELPDKVAQDIAGEIVTMLFPESFISDVSYPLVTPLESSGYPDVAALNSTFQKRSSLSYAPVAIEVEITNRCNLHCRECGILEDVLRGDYGLSADQILGVLAEAEKLGIYCYSLTGGEPTLRLDDLCRILAESPIDCFKIQSNGTFFDNPVKGKRVLERLAESGFGTRNKYVKASLSCSVGIQNRSEKSWNRAFGLIDDFRNMLDPSASVLSFVYTQDPYGDPFQAYVQFRRSFECASRYFFDSNQIHVRPIPLQYTPALADDHVKRFGTMKIGDWVREMEQPGGCFVTEQSTTPWPRILLRATGDVYACTCFAHVFRLGNILQDSLETILIRADESELFTILREGGIKALLEETEKKDPNIASKEVPYTIGRCGVCKILWDDNLGVNNEMSGLQTKPIRP